MDYFQPQHHQLAVPQHIPDPGSLSLPVDGDHPHRPPPNLPLLDPHRLVRTHLAHRLHHPKQVLLGPPCQLHPLTPAHPAQLPLERDPVLERRQAGGGMHHGHLAQLCRDARVPARGHGGRHDGLPVRGLRGVLGGLDAVPVYPPGKVQVAVSRHQRLLRHRHALHDDVGAGHGQGCRPLDDAGAECPQWVEELIVADDGGHQPDGWGHCGGDHQLE